MNCKICDRNSSEYFSHKVLNKYSVRYYLCTDCSYIFTEEPYWLKESYDSAINDSDTGILQRNLYLSRLVSVICLFFLKKNAEYLDYAGGYGLFTRRMRDIGFNFFWNDPYCENLLARGFEADLATGKKYEAITAFEVFEHLPDPIPEIKKMLAISDTIIFSTELITSSKLPDKDWWYFGFGHGQHVSFYSEDTFKKIAEITGTNFYLLNGLFILTKQKFNRFFLKFALLLTKVGLFQLTRMLITPRILDDFYYLRSKNKEDRNA